MAKIIKKILNETIKNFKGDKNLISVTPTGSFVDINKRLEKFNDLDLVFVFKKINKGVIKKFERFINYLNKSFSTNPLGITFTFKQGGTIKIMSKKLRTIMLHFLLWSKKEYVADYANIVKFSFQQNKPLYGKPLKEIKEFKPKKKELFSEFGGITTQKKRVKTGIIEYLDYNKKGEVMIKKIKLNPNQYLDALFYSVLSIAYDLVLVKEKYPFKIEESTKKFSEIFSIPNKNFPKEMLKLKKEFRKGKKFSKKEILELKNKSLQFIDQCLILLSRQKFY